MGFTTFPLPGVLPAPPGQVYSPLNYGAYGDGVHADDGAIAAAIAAIPSAGGILDMSGARVAYLVTHPIALNQGVSAYGTFIDNQDTSIGANKTDIVCAAGFAGLAVMADAGALASGASPSASSPVSIRGVSIDMTAITAGTPDAIRLMTFRSKVYDCFLRLGQFSANGVHITATNAGSNLITNTAVENKIRWNTILGAAANGILVDSTASKLTDGYIEGNVIEMVSPNLIAAPYTSSGAGIDCETGADWQLIGNHVYRIPGHAIIVNHAFDCFVCHNKVDNFGTAGAAGTTYRGIWVNGCNGPSTTVVDNEVDTDESHGTATTNYNYYQADGANSLSGVATLSNNACRRTANGNGGTSNAISSNAGSTGGTMRITEWGTTSQFTGTATAGPTLTPNLTGGATALRGPVAATSVTSPANPAGNGTTTTEAAGLALAFTPGLTGKMTVTVTGYVLTTVAVTTITMRLAQGTGIAPANGATTGLGTAFGNAITTQAPSTTVPTPFTLSGVVTGLAPGTPAWVDIVYSSGAAGDVATITNLTATIREEN